MTALGMRLMEKRESLGLSLQSVADRTKIPVNVLKSLEEGFIAGLPAPVFVKGFLRSYALLLGLSPEEIIAEYKSVAPEDPQAVAVPITARRGMEGRSRGRTWFLAFLLLIGIAVAVTMHYYNPWQNPAVETGPATAQQASPDVESPPPADVEPGGKTAEPEPAQPQADAEDPQDKTTSETKETGDEKPAVPAATAGHELKLVFDDECWLQIIIDDQEIEHGLYGPGMTKTWKAKHKFYVRLGNAGSVQVFFDGAALKTPGPRGRAVDLYLPAEGI